MVAPHNTYRTHPGGYNDWCVIVCHSDEEWQQLVDVMGAPGWARDERYATNSGRLEHQKALDRYIEAWTGTLNKYDITACCQAAGVPWPSKVPRTGSSTTRSCATVACTGRSTIRCWAGQTEFCFGSWPCENARALRMRRTIFLSCAMFARPVVRRPGTRQRRRTRFPSVDVLSGFSHGQGQVPPSDRVAKTFDRGPHLRSHTTDRQAMMTRASGSAPACIERAGWPQSPAP